jgi:hypothetical protein
MKRRLPNVVSIKLTEEDCRNCTWQLVEQTEDYRRYVGHGTHPVTGQEITVQKTEFLGEAQLLQENAERRNDTDNTPWSAGLGSEKGGNLPFIRVANIPLNKFYAEIAPRLQEGDKDFARWWANNEKNQAFRTRRGKV